MKLSLYKLKVFVKPSYVWWINSEMHKDRVCNVQKHVQNANLNPTVVCAKLEAGWTKIYAHLVQKTVMIV